MQLLRTGVGADLYCGIPEQELMFVDPSVIHHAPADVGVHSALLVASVYKLQAQLKVVAHPDLHCGQDQVNISHREFRLVSFAAILLCFFQDGLLLGAAWIARVNKVCSHMFSVKLDDTSVVLDVNTDLPETCTDG